MYWNLAHTHCRLIRGGMVQLFVGRKAVRLDVPRQLLCSASTYFEKAFSGGWKETNGRMALPEDDPTAFEILLY